MVEQEYLEELKRAVLELEGHANMFSFEDLENYAKGHGIPEKEVDGLIHELIAEEYIHKIHGTELYSRTVHKDYSQAAEKQPL
ncbi:TPA: hypothetical protein H1011_01785 [archaeon]|jgi:hypothetical protein|uniref:Uncharacterized protein n=1 Tax=Candidatus Undinarchaeum marinum TaxID=2756141 RepID=A0A832UYD6_9ARCH|nr:hypothetical protein [Candidatus Undinarchaeum marinum]